MADELLEMLVAEADRRVPGVKRGLEEAGASDAPHPERIEEIRVEVHGLKGAALVIGQQNLGRLAERAEHLLAASDGALSPDLAGDLSAAMDAFQAGAKAAANGEPEPPSVSDSLAALG